MIGEFIMLAPPLQRFLLFSLFLYSAPVYSQEPSPLPFSLVISEQLRSTFTLVGSGARAAGMGGAFTAVADDATAASFNPAGLAQLVLPETSVVFDRIYLTDRYRDFLLFDPVEPPLPLTDSDVKFNRNDFNFFSFTLPFQISGRRWAAQFSTQKVVDLTYRGDRQFRELDALRNPVVDFRQKSDQSGGIRLYSGSLAISATRRMLLGITINRWTGDWDFVGFSSETNVENPEEAEFLKYSQTNSLSGWNYDLGMLLQYRYANVGLRYRSSFSADYSFKAQAETNIPEQLKPLPDTTTKLDWPSTLNVGIALKPSDRLTLAVDYGRTDWSKMVFDFDVPDDPIVKVNFFDLRAQAVTLVRTAQDWRIGAEYLFFLRTAILPVRAGWFYEPQPGIDVGNGKRFVSRGVTAGAGIKIGWLAVDFAYQRKTSTTPITLFEPDDAVIGDPLNPSKGSLQRSENRVFASLIVQLPKNTFLDRLIPDIFVGSSTSN